MSDEACPRCDRTGVRHGAWYYAIGWAYTCDPDNAGRDVSTIRRVVDIATAETSPDDQ